MSTISKKRLIYKDKFEAYLISDENGNPLYAGQGKAYQRANKWSKPSRQEFFWGEIIKSKIEFRIFVETREEALEYEKIIIEKFKPRFNKNSGGQGRPIGSSLSENHKKKISDSIKRRIYGTT